MTIKHRLFALVTESVIGLVIMVSALLWTMNEVRIGGQLYNQIINDKDLLADILPPPEYAIETYLINQLILDFLTGLNKTNFTKINGAKRMV